MVRFVRCRAPLKIADFAAGDGGLLSIAQQKWSRASCTALDIAPYAVRRLRKAFPTWSLGQCDFLKPNSRRKSKHLCDSLNTFDVILLNPPFSCRGGRRHRVDVQDDWIECSLGFAFVLIAVEYLKNHGELIAILPASCMTSQKDREARQWLNENGLLEILSSNGRNTFAGCYPHTVILRFTKKRMQKQQSVEQSPKSSVTSGFRRIQLIRGLTQMHSVEGTSGKSLPFVHSTELRKDGVDISKRQASCAGRCVVGPAVLMHRVGLPSVDKVVLYGLATPIVLSDCVIALQCASKRESLTLLSTIRDNWSTFEATYGGTCAPYTTVKGLASALETLGYNVTIGSSQGREEDGKN